MNQNKKSNEKELIVSNTKEEFPSYNIIFKHGSVGASVCGKDFEEGFQQTTPLGFMNTRTLYAT
jgi:hypothetical protein